MSENVRDLEIIKCLLTTRTQREAAKCARCSEKTIYRRLDEPAFKAALDKAKAAILVNLTDELERLSLASVRRLWGYIEDDQADDKTVLRACGLALSHAARYRENVDLRVRLEALEDAIKANQ